MKKSKKEKKCSFKKKSKVWKKFQFTILFIEKSHLLFSFSFFCVFFYSAYTFLVSSQIETLFWWSFYCFFSSNILDFFFFFFYFLNFYSFREHTFFLQTEIVIWIFENPKKTNKPFLLNSLIRILNLKLFGWEINVLFSAFPFFVSSKENSLVILSQYFHIFSKDFQFFSDVILRSFSKILCFSYVSQSWLYHLMILLFLNLFCLQKISQNSAFDFATPLVL